MVAGHHRFHDDRRKIGQLFIREDTLLALVHKLLGKSEFKGISPVDAFCGMMDTRI